MGLALCIIFLAIAYYLSQRSLGRGIGFVMAIGYLYGVIRGWVNDGFSHFVFDSAVLGLYLAVLPRPAGPTVRERVAALRPWFIGLVIFPCLMFLMPINHPLVQLVGLRAACYFTPFVLIGARLEDEDMNVLAKWFAALNVMALGFAILEFFAGIEVVFPKNEINWIIYASRDVAGNKAHRLPACFPNAHAYGGAMLATLPFLINRWQDQRATSGEQTFMAGAIVASAIGIFMAAARMPAGILFVELAILAASMNVSIRTRVGMAVMGLVVAYFVMQSERMQRFTQMLDVDVVTNRVGGAYNESVWDVLMTYPLGSGLGTSFGTSIPYFLAEYAPRPIPVENEYARIWLEQSPFGLAAWFAFIVTTVGPRPVPVAPAWALGTRIMRAYVVCIFCAIFIGTGLFHSVPTGQLTLLMMGLLCSVRRRKSTAAAYLPYLPPPPRPVESRSEPRA